MFGISAFSQAPFSTLGAGATLLGEASVNSNASIAATPSRVRLFDANISAYAMVGGDGFSLARASGVILSNTSVTATGQAILSGIANVSGSSTATGIPYRIKHFEGDITTTATTDINYVRIRLHSPDILATSTTILEGYLLGQEWTDVIAGTEVWTDVSSGSEVWVEVATGTDTWLRKG